MSTDRDVITAVFGAATGLAGLLPVAWAEGGALLLTGVSLLGASFFMEKAAPAPSVEVAASPLPQAQPQEA